MRTASAVGLVVQPVLTTTIPGSRERHRNTFSENARVSCTLRGRAAHPSRRDMSSILPSDVLDELGDEIRSGGARPWTDLSHSAFHTLLGQVTASLWERTHHRVAVVRSEGASTHVDEIRSLAGSNALATNVCSGTVQSTVDSDDDDARDRVAAALDVLNLLLAHVPSSSAGRLTSHDSARQTLSSDDVAAAQQQSTTHHTPPFNSAIYLEELVVRLVQLNVLVPLLGLRRDADADVAEAANDCLVQMLGTPRPLPSALAAEIRNTSASTSPVTIAATHVSCVAGLSSSSSSSSMDVKSAEWVWALLAEIRRRGPQAFHVHVHMSSEWHPMGIAVVDVSSNSAPSSSSEVTVCRRLFYQASGLWEHGFAESDLTLTSASDAATRRSKGGGGDGGGSGDGGWATRVVSFKLVPRLCWYREMMTGAIVRQATAGVVGCSFPHNAPASPLDVTGSERAFLVLGVGGGLLMHAIASATSSTNTTHKQVVVVHGVEIDPLVTCASEYFFPSPSAANDVQVVIHHENAAVYCARAALECSRTRRDAAGSGCASATTTTTTSTTTTPAATQTYPQFDGIAVDVLTQGRLAPVALTDQLWADIASILCRHCNHHHKPRRDSSRSSPSSASCSSSVGGVVAVNAGLQHDPRTSHLQHLLQQHFGEVNRQVAPDASGAVVFVARQPRPRPGVCVRPRAGKLGQGVRSRSDGT